LKAEDYETAMGVLADLIQYDSVRAKFEWQMVTGIASCLVFKFKDYPRAEEMVQMLTPENRETLNEFYKGLLEKTEKDIAHNKSLGSAETPNTQEEVQSVQEQAVVEEPRKDVFPEE
jgi:hypothetical protein